MYYDILSQFATLDMTYLPHFALTPEVQLLTVLFYYIPRKKNTLPKDLPKRILVANEKHSFYIQPLKVLLDKPKDTLGF